MPFAGRRISAWAVLVVLVAVSTALRAYAARQVPIPWIAPDEMIYSLLGVGLYHTGHLQIFGGPTPFYSLLVPVFTGIPLSIGSFGFGYGLLKVLQALAMSLAAVPVYLWGRSLVSRQWALGAAALTLAGPGLAYSGLVMTEVLFYPLLTLAAWAMASAIARPTPRAQTLLVAASVAAAATRLQAIILLPALLGALALHAALTRSTRTARQLAPAVGALTAVALAWLGWRLAAGTPILGGYAGVTSTSYGVGDAAKFVVYHAGALLILTGVFPVCALLVLLVDAVRGGELSDAARAYVAVATSLVTFFVVEVGVFASEHVGRLAERDLLGLAPLLFLGLVLWVERGGGRRLAVTAGVALVAAAPLMALPVRQIVVDAAAPDALTLVPFIRLLHASSLHTVELVFYVGFGVAFAVFAFVPARLRALLPAILFATLAAASVSVSGYVADQAKARQAAFLGNDPHWIDDDVNGPVAYVYDGNPDWDGVWHTVFWNHSINRVYDLPGAQVPGALPQKAVEVLANGELAGLDRGTPAYVVVSTTFQLIGAPVTQIQQLGTTQGGLRLWKIDPPLRILSQSSGLRANGDIDPTGDGKIVGYDCRDGGTFLLTLLVKGPQTVVLARNGKPWKTLRFRSPKQDEIWRGQLPAEPSSSGVCTLDVQPTGLLGTTVFQFQPK